MRAVFGLGIYLSTGFGEKIVKNDFGEISLLEMDPPPRYEG